MDGAVRGGGEGREFKEEGTGDGPAVVGGAAEEPGSFPEEGERWEARRSGRRLKHQGPRLGTERSRETPAGLRRHDWALVEMTSGLGVALRNPDGG